MTTFTPCAAAISNEKVTEWAHPRGAGRYGVKQQGITCKYVCHLALGASGTQ